MKPDELRFSEKLVVRYPPHLAPLIDRAASRRFMTTSEYVRRSIFDQLVADGLCPAGGEHAGA